MRTSLLLLASCVYEPPLDPDAPGLLNGITGELVFAGGPEVATTYVTVFDAAAPPPPVGTGAPTTFAVVGADAFTGGGATQRSAPYALTRLPDGEVLLGALMDTDGDFQPLATTLAGATCGDWGGGHLASFSGSELGPIRLSGGRRVEDVTVLVGSPYETERPAFFLDGAEPIALSALAGALPPTVRLHATGVHTAFSEDLELRLGPVCPAAELPDCDLAPSCPCDLAATPPCAVAQWVWMKDDDLDGAVDPYPAEAQAAAGVLDVWPRVYLAYTGELGTFTVDGEEKDERWVAEAYPLLLELAGTIGAGGDPSALGPVGVPFPVEQLSVTLSSTFLHYHADGADGVDTNGPYDLVDVHDPAGLAAVPDGAWAVTVVSFTGQTWTVPNEIGLEGLPSLDPAFDPAGQAGALVLRR